MELPPRILSKPLQVVSLGTSKVSVLVVSLNFQAARMLFMLNWWLSFKSIYVFPWCLRNRWQNCLFRIWNMRFVVTHIYREGNACADSLANLGLSFPSFELFWSDYIPNFIRGEYTRNRLGIPNLRFNIFWKSFGLVPLFFLILFLVSLKKTYFIIMIFMQIF